MDDEMKVGQRVSLLRVLGPGMAVAIVVGNVIGSGIFATPGGIAADGRGFSLIISAWVFGGVLSLLGGLCFAELGAMLPRAGGMYVYLKHAYGRPVGYLQGWTQFIFGNPGFDLTHQIGADVRALGEDAAAETREDRDQRRPEAEGHQGFQNVTHAFGGGRVDHAAQRDVVAGNAQQGQADHQHAGDGAGFEGNVQTARQALGLGGFGGAHVGADRDVHADVAGDARQDGADEVADGHGHAQLQAEQDADHGADDGDGRVLAVQVSARAFLNGARNFLHLLVARSGTENLSARKYSVDYGQQAKSNSDQNKFHALPPPGYVPNSIRMLALIVGN